ncbi:hypothetical protein, partial [Chryseobacterium taihuense]
CPTDPTHQPCNGNGVSTGLIDPNTNIGEGGCAGIPTVVEMPLPTVDPCIKSQRSVTAANNVLNSTEGQQMTTALKAKVGDPVEWAMAIGELPNNGGTTITSAAPGGQFQGTVPSLPAGYNAVGDGHSHAKGIASPSGGDLYHMLEGMFTSTYGAPNPNFKYRFVYGYGQNTNVKETYALVINDITLAQQFWNAFPMSENYDPDTHAFKKDSDLWNEVEKAKVIFNNKSAVIDTSGEFYHTRAIGLVYILDKFNAGISIAKADANGNLKKINASTEEITRNGMKDERAKISKCP